MFPFNNTATVNTNFYLTFFCYRGLFKWSRSVIKYFGSFVTYFDFFAKGIRNFFSFANEPQRRTTRKFVTFSSISLALKLSKLWTHVRLFDKLNAQSLLVATILRITILSWSFREISSSSWSLSLQRQHTRLTCRHFRPLKTCLPLEPNCLVANYEVLFSRQIVALSTAFLFASWMRLLCLEVFPCLRAEG